MSTESSTEEIIEWCDRYFTLLMDHELWIGGRKDSSELEGGSIIAFLNELEFAKNKAMEAIAKEKGGPNL